MNAGNVDVSLSRGRDCASVRHGDVDGVSWCDCCLQLLWNCCLLKEMAGATCIGYSCDGARGGVA